MMTDPPHTLPTDPQTQFVLYCLQSRFNPAVLEMARSVAAQDKFDWESTIALINHENLAPLLYAIVHGHDLLPSHLEQETRDTYLRNAIRNALLFEELAHILEKFAAEKISLIMLKGTALAETIYNNIAVRPMVDIDILVHSEDVKSALNQLKSLAYSPVEPESHPGIITEYENELLLQKSGHIDVALELHWSLLDSPHYQQKIRMDWFWQSAVPAQFTAAPGLVLGPEALLLHLCSHLMLHHRGQGLLWLHDIAEVLVQYRTSLNWETLLHKAQDYDLVLSLQRILTQVTLQWNIELPPGILDKTNELRPSPRELKVFNWLTAAERPIAQRFWADLATSSSWQRRLEYAWHSLLPSPDYMHRRYQINRPLLLPFYYPYRWLVGIFSIFRK